MVDRCADVPGALLVFSPEYLPCETCSLIGMQVMHELSVTGKGFGWRLCVKG